MSYEAPSKKLHIACACACVTEEVSRRGHSNLKSPSSSSSKSPSHSFFNPTLSKVRCDRLGAPSLVDKLGEGRRTLLVGVQKKTHLRLLEFGDIHLPGGRPFVDHRSS